MRKLDPDNRRTIINEMTAQQKTQLELFMKADQENKHRMCATLATCDVGDILGSSDEEEDNVSSDLSCEGGAEEEGDDCQLDMECCEEVDVDAETADMPSLSLCDGDPGGGGVCLAICDMSHGAAEDSEPFGITEEQNPLDQG